MAMMMTGAAKAMSAADVDCFERERRRLVALAYRMLGSMVDAEDVVQDGWLRWNRLGAGRPC